MGIRGMLIAAILFGSVASGAQAQGQAGVYTGGEDLTFFCRAFMSMRQKGGGTTDAQEGVSSGMCYSYVIGVQDTMAFRGFDGDQQPPFCIEQGTNGNSVVEVVAQWLDKHPAQRNKAAIFLVRQALAEGFPCK